MAGPLDDLTGEMVTVIVERAEKAAAPPPVIRRDEQSWLHFFWFDDDPEVAEFPARALAAPRDFDGRALAEMIDEI